MKPNDYAKLEKDYSFKQSYLKNTLWWKNIVFIAPSLILFIGLLGILYLFKNDSLVTLYVIPYLLLFVVGTIWLKATKKHIQKAMMNIPGAFHICLAKPMGEKDGYVYAAFVNNGKRYDKYYIANEIQDLPMDTIVGNPVYKKKAVLFENEKVAEIYIRAYQVRDVNKRNASWREDELFEVLFINEKDTPIVKKRDLMEVSNKK